MKNKLTSFYRGEKGARRLLALQNHINTRILSKIKPNEKAIIWTPLPGLTGADIYPFIDNQRLPFGNGALDHVIIIHGADITQECNALMTEAVRMVRDHGLIDVIGWTKPKYDHGLPIWERARRRLALRLLDPLSLKWRRYEKVQDLMTLTFTGQKVDKKVAMTVAMPSPRSASSNT